MDRYACGKISRAVGNVDLSGMKQRLLTPHMELSTTKQADLPSLRANPSLPMATPSGHLSCAAAKSPWKGETQPCETSSYCLQLKPN